ncbi:MAG: hypothetical protein HY738_18295 [Bacteroidia bacterium]|nr:hypothetical protein [Bacteroidia bacterium]
MLPQEVKQIIIKFADGNPREALLLCQNAMLSKQIHNDYQNEDFILRLDEIKQEMGKFLWARVNRFNFSQREKEFLEAIYQKDKILKSDFTNSKILKIPISTKYKIIEKFLTNKVIEELEPDTYKLNRKVQLFYEFIGFR